MIEQGSYRAKSIASSLFVRKSMMTPDEVAQLLGMKKATILRWARNGTIPAVRIKNIVMFDPGNVARWLVSRGDKSESVPPLKR